MKTTRLKRLTIGAILGISLSTNALASNISKNCLSYIEFMLITNKNFSTVITQYNRGQLGAVEGYNYILKIDTDLSGVSIHSFCDINNTSEINFIKDDTKLRALVKKAKQGFEQVLGVERY